MKDTIHEFQDDDALADHDDLLAHASDCEDDDTPDHDSEDGVDPEADGDVDEHDYDECGDAPVLSALGEGPSLGKLTREQADVAGQFEKKTSSVRRGAPTNGTHWGP